MITKYPPLVKFSEILNLYENHIIEYQLENDDAKKVTKYITNKETSEMEIVRNKIIYFLKGNQCNINHLNILMVYYKQLFIINNLEYFSKSIIQKDIKNSDKQYKIMKVQFPQIEGKEISVRVSVGVYDEQKNKVKPLEQRKKEMETLQKYLNNKKLIEKSIIDDILNT